MDPRGAVTVSRAGLPAVRTSQVLRAGKPACETGSMCAVNSHRSKPIIGIAGGIGSGKSTVARILADLGCVVSNSDDAARAALDDADIRRRIVEHFGDSVQNEDGSINRSTLAGIVFNDPDQRQALEAITHPWIEARRRELFDAAPADAPALVIDAPLLFEAGLDGECDYVIFVDTPRETRLQRVQAHRGWDEAELRRREDSQLPLDEKRLRADDIVINNGQVRDLLPQVRDSLTRAVDMHRNGGRG